MTHDDEQHIRQQLSEISSGIAKLQNGVVSRLDARLDDIENKVTEMSVVCPLHRESLTACLAAVKELYVTIHGSPENGSHPGILGRLQSLEGKQRLVDVILGAVGGIVASGCAAAVVAAVQGWI